MNVERTRRRTDAVHGIALTGSGNRCWNRHGRRDFSPSECRWRRSDFGWPCAGMLAETASHCASPTCSVAGDVADSDCHQRICDAIAGRPLHYLVQLAGMQTLGPIESLTRQDWEASFATLVHARSTGAAHLYHLHRSANSIGGLKVVGDLPSGGSRLLLLVCGDSHAGRMSGAEPLMSTDYFVSAWVSRYSAITRINESAAGDLSLMGGFMKRNASEAS